MAIELREKTNKMLRHIQTDVNFSIIRHRQDIFWQIFKIILILNI